MQPQLTKCDLTSRLTFYLSTVVLNVIMLCGIMLSSVIPNIIFIIILIVIKFSDFLGPFSQHFLLPYIL
jgi:hypothetical protein